MNAPYYCGVEYTSTSIMSLPLSYPETLENKCAHIKYPSLLAHFSPIYHNSFTFKPHAHMHCVVIIVVAAMLTSCYSTMSHAALVLYYRACMLTLHTALISCALCFATCMKLGRLECISMGCSNCLVWWK